MPLPIITNTVRAAAIGKCPGGAPCVNILHFQHSGGPPSPSDITALDTKLLKYLTGPQYTSGLTAGVWNNNANSAFELDEIRYTILDGTSATTVVTHIVPATGTGTRLPDEVAFVLTLRTATRGRRFRGRQYLPPKETSMLTAGLVSSSTAAPYVAQAAGFLSDLGSISWVWGVASYLTSVITPITQVTMDPYPDVQRRRKR